VREDLAQDVIVTECRSIGEGLTWELIDVQDDEYLDLIFGGVVVVINDGVIH
jgi:hypothetical protein